MKNKQSLLKFIKNTGIGILLLSSVLFILLDIFFSLYNYKEEIAFIRERSYKTQKKYIKEKVNQVIKGMNREIKIFETNSQELANTKVKEAYSIATNIHQKFKNTRNSSELKKMIIEALRNIRFENQHGHYSITTLKGKRKLNPINPELEGQNWINKQDVAGNFFIKEELTEVEKNKKYYTERQSLTKTEDSKIIISALLFEPYQWSIASEIYMSDVEDELQQYLGEELSSIHYQSDGYFFAFDEDITFVSHIGKKYIGKNLCNLQDADGVFINQELRRAARKKEGGFVEYLWNRYDSNNKETAVAKKISYANSLNRWGWTIGTGLYVEDLEGEIEIVKSKYKEHIFNWLFITVLAATFVIIIFLFIIHFINDAMRKDLEYIINFFTLASASDNEIDRNELKFLEFDALAETANKMQADRIVAQKKQQEDNELLLVTIRSIGDGVVTTDQKGRVVLLNDVAERLTGWQTIEAKGMELTKIFKIFNSITNEPVDNPVEKVLSTGKIVGLANHTVLVSKLGERFQIADSASPIQDSNGKISGCILVFRDVTEEYRKINEIIKSEKEYRLITETTSEYVSKVDFEGNYLFVNKSHIELGYEPEDLLGKNLFSLLHQDDITKISELFKDGIINPKKQFSAFTFRILSAYGDYHHLQSFVNIIFDEDGEGESFLIISRDISNKIQIEALLAKEHEQLEMVIESANIGWWDQDIPSGNLKLSKILLKNLGYKTHEVDNKTFFGGDRIHPEDLQRVKDDFDRHFAGEADFYSNEHRLKTKDGVWRWFSDYGKVVEWNADESPKRMIGTLRDINEVKKYELDLIEKEKSFESIFENAIDAIYILSPQGKFLNVNKAVLDMYGYSKEELIGKDPSFTAAEGKNDFEKVGNYIEAALNGKPQIFDFWAKRKNGEIFLKVVKLSQGYYYGEQAIFAFALDVTEQRDAAKEIQKSQKLQSIGVFAGGIAHDFNNILTGIFGNITLAKLSLPPENEALNFLNDAANSMGRATSLTQQLLTFAKGGELTLRGSSIDAVIKEVVNFDLSGSNIKPVFSQEDNLWDSEIDKGQMQQVFSNLTINAMQAMPNGGHLFVDIKNHKLNEESLRDLPAGDYTKITFRDEGVGISEENLEKIFDPYYTTKETGSGLGLATLFSIIKKHKGHISVSSIINEGTTFSILLPATAGGSTLEDLPVEESINLKGGKILFIDDDEIILEVGKKMLENLGYFVDTAIDGKIGCDIYKEALQAGDSFDAIISDKTIPGGWGSYEVLEYLLSIDSSVKVILASGYIVEADVDPRFAGTIAKPFTFESLKITLNGVLNES